ncbi:MAG: hypothetical protein IPJ14_06925 [Kineosporiaceae bacterium]|nr:hypothetical protein [Kineosporiaceae bacterium]
MGRRVAMPRWGGRIGCGSRSVGRGRSRMPGVVLPRLLADRLGLSADLAAVVARAAFIPVRHRGRLLVDTACALAAGATGLTDVEALTRQVEIFGPGGGASDSTVLRGLDELSDRLGANGLPGRRLARSDGQGTGEGVDRDRRPARRTARGPGRRDRTAPPADRSRPSRAAGPAGGRGPTGRHSDPRRLR